MRFSSFVFTGKELDSETGYRYFGARYMDYEVLTGWLSVDPMMDKYPISRRTTIACGIPLLLWTLMEWILFIKVGDML